MKKSIAEKSCSLLMIILMIASLFPISAFAEGNESVKQAALEAEEQKASDEQEQGKEQTVDSPQEDSPPVPSASGEKAAGVEPEDAGSSSAGGSTESSPQEDNLAYGALQPITLDTFGSTADSQFFAYDDYDADDVAAMNQIIEDHPELGLNPYISGNSPDWDAFIRWNNIGSAGQPHYVITYVSFTNRKMVGTLDISKLQHLQTMKCGDNNLEGLILGGQESLLELNCYSNQIASIDTTGLVNLKVLIMSKNELNTLEVNHLESLESLYFDENDITTMDVNGLANLRVLQCYDGVLESLRAVNLPSLTWLAMDRNDLSTLEMSGLDSLDILRLENNNLSGTLDLSGFPALGNLYCLGNSLTGLNTTGLTSLTFISAYHNELEGILDVSTNVNLVSLYVHYNNLTGVNLQNLVSLQDFRCQVNQITSLESIPTTVEYLACHSNQLVRLELRPLLLLKKLYAYDNPLNNLNLYGLVNLKSVYCSDDPMRTLITPAGQSMSIALTSGVVMGIPGDPEPWATGNYGYNVLQNTATLTAAEGRGMTFESWELSLNAALVEGSKADKQITLDLSDSLWVKPVFRYEVYRSASYDGDWQDRTVAVAGDMAYFLGAMVEGKEISATAGENGIVLTLPSGLLESLGNGAHTIDVLYTDGYAESTLMIEIDPNRGDTPVIEDPENPLPVVTDPAAAGQDSSSIEMTGDIRSTSISASTGDFNDPIFWLGISALLVLVGSGCIVWYRLRKMSTSER